MANFTCQSNKDFHYYRPSLVTPVGVVVSLLTLQVFKFTPLTLYLLLLPDLLLLNPAGFCILIVHLVTKQCSTESASGCSDCNSWSGLTGRTSDNRSQTSTKGTSSECSGGSLIHRLRTGRG
jgi:hypothetical protein